MDDEQVIEGGEPDEEGVGQDEGGAEEAPRQGSRSLRWIGRALALVGIGLFAWAGTRDRVWVLERYGLAQANVPPTLAFWLVWGGFGTAALVASWWLMRLGGSGGDAAPEPE